LQPIKTQKKRSIRNNTSCWLVNQQWGQWWSLGNTKRQGLELILVPYLGIKTRLSLNRMQSRVVTCLLTGHNTLRRHFHLMGLIESTLCRMCGAEGETSAYNLCRCEALVSLTHV
jgi:hypothetical protein